MQNQKKNISLNCKRQNLTPSDKEIFILSFFLHILHLLFHRKNINWEKKKSSNEGILSFGTKVFKGIARERLSETIEK